MYSTTDSSREQHNFLARKQKSRMRKFTGVFSQDFNSLNLYQPNYLLLGLLLCDALRVPSFRHIILFPSLQFFFLFLFFCVGIIFNSLSFAIFFHTLKYAAILCWIITFQVIKINCDFQAFNLLIKIQLILFFPYKILN